MVYRSQLPELDEAKAALAGSHPGWHIWYVPHGDSSGISRVVWCAYPLPLLNCDSPEELAEQMAAADGWRAGSAPQKVEHDDDSATVISTDGGQGPVASHPSRT
jgi:hypothetical protein